MNQRWVHLSRNKSQAERRRLFALDPRCHWCGVVTIDPRDTHFQNPEMCTLDHIRSRLQCNTRAEYRSGKNKVIACLKCNGERDRELHLRARPHVGAAETRFVTNRVWHQNPAVDVFAPPSWEMLWQLNPTPGAS